MPTATDDHVVVHHHAERGRGFFDVLGYRDVGLRRGRVARGVIVHQDQGCGAEIKCALDDLARVDRRVVDGAALLHATSASEASLVIASSFPRAMGSSLRLPDVITSGRSPRIR